MCGRFIEKRCLYKEEKLLEKGHEHWMHIIYGLNWLIILGGVGYAISYGLRFYAGIYEGFPNTELFGIPLGYDWWWSWYIFQTIGFIVFMIEYIGYVSREVAITDQRFIMKTGLIFIDVLEVDLGEIRNEEVDHKLLGAWLGYGSVILDARFVDTVDIPVIRHPHQFLMVLHKARAQVQDPLEDY